MSFASSATHRTATATKTRINSGKENTSSSKTTSATSLSASSKPKPKQPTSTSTSTSATSISTKPHSSLTKTQTKPTAPLASLPFSQRRQNPTSTSTTASAPPIRSSISAKPRVVAQSKQTTSTQIQRPASSTTQNPVRNNQAPARKPVSVATRSQIQDDSFGTVNLDDILGADSTKDLDSRNTALKSSNPSATSRPVAGAGRRNTTFAGSQSRALQEDGESVRKRASIYAGPVRVIKKNPNATVPIMNQQPDESMTNYRESLLMSSRPAQRAVDDYSTSSQLSQHFQGPQRHQQHQSINNYSNEAPFPQLASRPTFNAAAAGLVPLPPTPLKPPQRVPITNNNAMNHHPQPQTNSSTQNSLPQPTPTPQDLSSTLLTEAVASTSLYRTSSATSTSAPQILHTPRRVLEQTKARNIGMAVMDMLGTPSRIQQTPGRGQLRASASSAGGGGNLMHRFQEVIEDEGVIGGVGVAVNARNKTDTGSISDVTVESVKTDMMTTPPRYAPPVVVESPRSAGKTKLPVFGGAGVGRGLLPDPFEVLGITVDSSKSMYVGAGIPDVFASMREETRGTVEANVWDEPKDVAIVEMTDSGEKDGGEGEVVAVTHEESVGKVEAVDSNAMDALSTNATTSDNVNVMWKQVSPRREGLVGDGGEYRGGIRADPVECSAANTSVTGKRREDLSELEQRFRGITSQLMARVHTETTEVEPLAKAAEPASVQLESQHDPESLKNMSDAASIPPGDVKSWHLQMPDLGEMDQEKIKFEIDTLDEEEKQLMREIMKLEGKFS